MTAPIPVASLGCDAKISEAIRQRLLPEYDVVHICLNPRAAENELPALFSGDLSTANAAGLGSNASRPVDSRVVPLVVLFGGTVTSSDMQRVGDAIRVRSPHIRHICVSKKDIFMAGGFGPNPDIIAKVYRKKMAEDNLPWKIFLQGEVKG